MKLLTLVKLRWSTIVQCHYFTDILIDNNSVFGILESSNCLSCRCKGSIRQTRKPFWCAECQIGFSLKGNLTKHIQKGLCLRNKKVKLTIVYYHQLVRQCPRHTLFNIKHRYPFGCKQTRQVGMASFELSFTWNFAGNNELRGSFAENGRAWWWKHILKQEGEVSCFYDLKNT